MKAKDIANQLGSLAAATGSMPGNYDNGDIDNDLPEDLIEPDPIFVVEHEKVISEKEDKALKSVKQIVNSIVPAAYQNNPIIKDKISQDAEQLGQLYYQQDMNNIVIKTIMDTISKGDLSSKIFDSYTKLMSIAKDFNKQINDMQNQFRKYYIDTYRDLQTKEDEDIIASENGPHRQPITDDSKKEETAAITYEQTENIDRRETSTRDATIKIQDWKREQYRQMYSEKAKVDDAEEAEEI